ncbi:MAG: hypothetical protein CUN55_19640, partial [Phototrophicales bacterium]
MLEDRARCALISVEDHIMGYTRGKDQSPSWAQIADESDGFIIIVPEYNHAYPGELKIMLDSAYEEYKRKPAAVIGVSSGGFGGSRAVEALRLALLGMSLTPIPAVAYVSQINQENKDQVLDDMLAGKSLKNLI